MILLFISHTDCLKSQKISAHARDEQDSKGDIIDEAAKDRIESGINNPNSNNEDKLYKLIFEIVLEVNWLPKVGVERIVPSLVSSVGSITRNR
jgi:hypothetical protein